MLCQGSTVVPQNGPIDSGAMNSNQKLNQLDKDLKSFVNDEMPIAIDALNKREVDPNLRPSELQENKIFKIDLCIYKTNHWGSKKSRVIGNLKNILKKMNQIVSKHGLKAEARKLVKDFLLKTKNHNFKAGSQLSKDFAALTENTTLVGLMAANARP